MNAAIAILTSFIRANPDSHDIDRLVAMSAYMAMKLATDMTKPLEQLEAEVWPELTDSAYNVALPGAQPNSQPDDML